MPGTQCEYVHPSGQQCGNEAMQKCTGPHCNGGVYCVKHIQFIDFRYICDTCIQETECISREARRVSREIERELAQEKILAREHARQQSKIRYPRIMGLLSMILVVPAYITYFLIEAYHPYATPLIKTNPLLAYTFVGMLALGGILLLITWVWVIIYAIRRKQSGWLSGLLFAGVIALLLYLIHDPVD